MSRTELASVRGSPSGGLPRHLRSKVDVEDLNQEAWVRALEARPDLATWPDGEARAYLRRVFDAVLIDTLRRYDRGLRRAGRERSLGGEVGGPAGGPAAEQSSPSQRASRAEQDERLAEALAALPEPQREAIRLHRFLGLSIRETAEAMALPSVASAAGHLRRGLEALRERLLWPDGS
jgi:RNA polymerase sigma-70 factor (ECF subfamily)